MVDITEHLSQINPSKSASENLSNNYIQAIDLENKKVVGRSPGVVADNEQLARILISPLHVNEDGSIQRTAFNDCSSFGLSSNRMTFCSESEIHEQGEKKAEKDRLKNPDKQYYGFIKCNAKLVRDLNENGCQIFGIYDTALRDNINHADIFLLIRGPRTEEMGSLKAKAARKLRLEELAEKYSQAVLAPQK